MSRLDCTSDCYTDLSFMGVAYDPNCDVGLCHYLNKSGEDVFYDNGSCCVDECCC